MRILFICAGGYVYGKELLTLSLMKELRAHNHEVYCVNSSWNNGEFGRLINEAEIPAKELPLGFISKTLSWSAIRMTLDQLQRVPSLWWNYRKLLRAFKPQVVVHSNFHHLILLWPLLSGTTNVFHVHDSFQPTRFYRVVLKLLEMRLRLFIGVSKFVAQSLVDLGMPRTKVAHVLNGIAEVHPSDKSKPLAAGRHDPLRIGIIGQVGQWKGHDLLVDALQLLKSRGDRFVCRIFGDGDPIYSAALKDKISGSGLSYEMEWKGFVIDKNSIYSSIDLCVVPSRALEPFGMVAAEASLHGIPVIATRRGGLPEVIVDQETGYLVDASAEQLAEKLELLMRSENLRTTMGNAAREHALKNLTSRRMVQQFEELLTPLI